MPLTNTPYGPMEEAEIKAAQDAVLQLCPQPGGEEDALERCLSGERYQRLGPYLIAGPVDGYPETQTQGLTYNDEPDHQQGYKLHVAALPGDAPAILQAVQGALRGADCPLYKVDARVLDERSQPGKFITIYARDPEHLKQLAGKVQTALFENNLGPHNAAIPGRPGQKMSGSGDMEIGGSKLLSMRYGAFCGDRHGNHEEEIWVHDKDNDNTNKAGWVVDNREHDAHNHPCLKAEFDSVANPLDAELKQEWAEKERIRNERRIERQQRQMGKRGAVILDRTTLADSFAQQSAPGYSSTSSSSSSSSSMSATPPAVKDSVYGRRPAPPRPARAMNNNNNQTQIPTVEEVLHRAPPISQEELNQQRSKMGLPPPPHYKPGGGGKAAK